MGGTVDTVETLRDFTERLLANSRAAYAAFEADMMQTTNPKLYLLRRLDGPTDREAIAGAVIVATDEATARRLHPRTGKLHQSSPAPCKCCGMSDPSNGGWRDGGWAPTPDAVEAVYIGMASDKLKTACPGVLITTTVGSL